LRSAVSLIAALMLRKSLLFIAIIGFFAAIVAFGIRSFASNRYPYPSEAYYLNDFAEVFSSTTENFLIGEAESLHETTKDIEDVGGAQIVFATYLLEEGEDLSDYDKNIMFEEWKIGQNNMGLLAVFFFSRISDETIGCYDLVEFQIEASDEMMIYLPVTTQLNIYNRTLGYYLPKGTPTNPYDFDLEIGAASMMNEFLNVAYGHIYDMPDEVIPQEEFDPSYETHWLSDDSPSRYKANYSLNMLDYFFSPYGTVYDRIIFGCLSALFAVAGGGAGIFKAKGGMSSGGGLFRHR